MCALVALLAALALARHLSGAIRPKAPVQRGPSHEPALAPSFSAVTQWFEQVAWDIGLVANDPERQRLAVLAATDTD
ncbi:MAG: hypothetical protein JWL58_7151 [Streptosporangiaceae bacterium]|nr:hypothetical protein [Streptosporangiaceae bacterium]